MNSTSPLRRFCNIVAEGSEYGFVDSNAWWLRSSRGATASDRLVLSLLKTAFLGTRFLLKVIMGRKRRDEWFAKRHLTFKKFLYSATEPFGLGRLSLEISVPKHGYKIRCPLNREDLIVMTRHEDEMIDRFDAKHGDTVIDIGAHMGRYTIISSKRVGKEGKVIAIEAHPGNFGLLRRNIALNRLTNVTAINCAVYSKKMPLKLYLPDEDSGYTMHHSVMSSYLVTKYKEAERKYMEVQADTLDSLLHRAGVDRVDWIKIDVEGAELEVLKGAGETLSKNKNISLLVEVHGRETYAPAMDLLRTHGFRVEFERTYDNGEKHVIARKGGSSSS
jgi:FkbM family methyltransferase